MVNTATDKEIKQKKTRNDSSSASPSVNLQHNDNGKKNTPTTSAGYLHHRNLRSNCARSDAANTVCNNNIKTSVSASNYSDNTSTISNVIPFSCNTPTITTSTQSYCSLVCSTYTTDAIKSFVSASVVSTPVTSGWSAMQTTSSSLTSDTMSLLKSSQHPFKDTVISLLTDLINKLNSMNADHNRQIADLHESISQMLNSCDKQAESSITIKHLEQRLDTVERQLRADELIIDGIPALGDDDNLQNVVNTLAKVVDSPVPLLRSLYRIKPMNAKNNVSSDGTIVLKFLNAGDKILFKRKIANFIKNSKTYLKLSHFGCDSNKKVYIHDRLTRHNYHLMRKAMKLKAEKNFYQVFTINGVVFLSRKKGQKPIRISNSADLATISNMD